MFLFILRRIAQSALLMLGVLALVFFLVRLTGDPVALMVSRQATPEQIEARREQLGLNRPLAVQFADYIGGVLRGDLGESLRKNQSNLLLIRQRLPATLHLASMALLFAVVIAIPIGVLAGMRPRSWLDGLARVLGLAGQTVPNFWLAMLLIVWLAIPIAWIPTSGRDKPLSVLLPMIALGFAGMGQLVRLTRAAVLDVRSQDYVKVATAKGLGKQVVSFKHVVPNIAVALISVIGIQFTYLLGGSVYIESVFAWPGLGGLLETAIRDNDFPLVQAITIFISLFAVGTQLITDIAYGLIDPRVRIS